MPKHTTTVSRSLQDLRRHKEALTSFETAIILKPDYAEAYNNHGNALHDLRPRDEGALISFAKAIALKPDYAGAYRARGIALNALKRYKEALASYEQARHLALDPDMPWLLGDVLSAKRQLCDWTSNESLALVWEDRIGLGQKVAAPFILTELSDSPALQKKAAEIFTRSQYPANDELAAPYSTMQTM